MATDCKKMVSLLKVYSQERTYHAMVDFTDARPHSLKITVTSGTEIWCGEVSQEELESQAKATERSFDDFWLVTKSALSCDNNTRTGDQFCCDVKTLDGSLEFSWKKIFRHDVKFQLGSVLLHKNQHLNVGSFLDVAVDQFKQMKEEISTLYTSNAQLLKERERMIKSLEMFKTAKSNLEEDLFKKFVAVLNEKKAKIRKLQKQCEDNLKLPRTSHQAAKESEGQREDFSSDEEETTDDERDQLLDKSAEQATLRKEMPSILDQVCGEEAEQPPTVKRKKRNKLQRQTTSSVMPRTTSLPRPCKDESISRRDSTSNKRQTPVAVDPQTDPDNLMDQL